MDRLPSNIMLDIFSRLPLTSLACSRCVSKVWCEYVDDPYLTIIHDERVLEEPIPILYHTHIDHERRTSSLSFRVIESKQTRTTYHTYFLKPKEDPCFQFVSKEPRSKYYNPYTEVRGAYNGLMCLSQKEGGIITSLVVVNPLRKECYELPPLPDFRPVLELPPPLLLFDFRSESCGLGFDASTNTLKMVCVRDNLSTMVHVFGTNSWRIIPQVPPYRIMGGAVFANGCLHWVVSFDDIKTEDCGRPVIWFDVEKEEFGLIDPPKIMYDNQNSGNYWGDDHLVDLNGEVGFCISNVEIVYVLKQKEWVPYCRLEIVISNNGFSEVLGCWNKDGDMLIKHNGYEQGYDWFFVYNIKSGVLRKIFFVGQDHGYIRNIFMHPNKLFSIMASAHVTRRVAGENNIFEKKLPAFCWE